MKKLLLVAALLSAASAVPTSAAVIHWTVQNATFDDGTTLTGGFDIDDGTLQAGAFDFSVAAGAIGAYHYTDATDRYIPFTSTRYLFASGLSGSINNYLSLDFAQTLSMAGTVSLLTGNGGTSYECDNCSPVRYLTSGSVTSEDTSAVPEPAMLGLFGLGAAGLVASRRRKAA